jgi:hypothetical protein
MNITALEVQGFEADDVIGTVSGLAEQAGFEVFMATPDKDYGQLVTDHVFMYRPRHTGGFELMGPKEVCDKYGLQNKDQVIDLLGLMGDASDNIPGCKGVGEKTAVALLQQFGSIDNMLARTEEIKGALRQKVESQVEEIKVLKKAIESFKAKENAGAADRFLVGAHTIGDLKVFTANIPDADAGKLRQMGDTLRDKAPNVVAVLSTVAGDKVTFLAICGKEAIAKGMKAGELVKLVCSACGGSGGGKPDSAMGGGKDATKVDDALAQVDNYVNSKLA